MPLHPWLSIDLADAAERIPRKMREIVSSTLLRRGFVVAVSGGIDSSVCAVLATLAMGKEKVFALVLPERDSSPRSKELGVQLCEYLGMWWGLRIGSKMTRGSSLKTATVQPTSSRSPISTRARSTSSQTTSDSPNAICAAQPTTDTYSLAQGQDEFFFVLPYNRMDIILCGLNGGKRPRRLPRRRD